MVDRLVCAAPARAGDRAQPGRQWMLRRPDGAGGHSAHVLPAGRDGRVPWRPSAAGSHAALARDGQPGLTGGRVAPANGACPGVCTRLCQAARAAPAWGRRPGAASYRLAAVRRPGVFGGGGQTKKLALKAHFI